MKFYDVLKGEFLVSESAFKNWRIILFVVFLFMCMISSSHRADQKVMEIAEMNKEMKMLKALYIDSGTILTRLKMESSIKERVKARGLDSSKTPPIKIKVTSKED